MKEPDNKAFITPDLRSNYDLFVIRKALLSALTRALPELKGTLVDVGCGTKPYRDYILNNSGVGEYIGVEWEKSFYLEKIKPEKYWDGKTLPFEEASIDSCMATEVLEHLSNPKQVTSEMYRILKPGGTLFLTVPFLWPLHEIPFDEYRYTPFSMKRILKEAGFKEENILITASGGWFACLAQMITHTLVMEFNKGLTRKILTRLSYPLIRWLLAHDRPPVTFEKNHTMFLGLSVVARK